ncbi:MAG: hypothetical protein ACK4MV_16615 [Beijerinckiaceae bacterium]
MFPLLAIPRLWLIGGMVAAIVFGGWYIVHSIRKDAQDDIIRSIEKEEDHARKRAVEGARSVDACWDAGGVWDRATGSCRLP